MDEIVPTQFLGERFHMVVKKVQEMKRSGNIVYYRAVTTYGTMCLVIEHHADLVSGCDTLQFLKRRNEVIRKYGECFPLIYEQDICVSHPQQIVCISLMEECKFLADCFGEVVAKMRISSIAKLVKSLFSLESEGFGVRGALQASQLIYCASNPEIYIDFTSVVPSDAGGKQEASAEKVLRVVEWVLAERYGSGSTIKQIILIQDKIYRFDIGLLKQAQDLLEIMLMLNICLDLEVELLTVPPGSSLRIQRPSSHPHQKGGKPSLAKIKELNGCQKFRYGPKQYERLVFASGRCINSLVQVEYSELKQKFLKQNAHYRLRKHENLFVELSEVSEKANLNSGVITVHPPVAKIQLINFIIVYMRCIEPLIKSIVYIKSENSLQIEFVSKSNENKSVKICFHNKYVVKDEEISMILERAKIKDCRLDLRYMRINDTLLMFLGNSEKTSRISEFSLSDCYGLSDHGVSILLLSPFCKDLQGLTLLFDDSLLVSSIESLGLKSNVRKLHLKRNVKDHPKDTKLDPLQIPKMKLQELCTEGIKISLSSLNPCSLKILKMTQPFHIDEFKYLKQFQLVELRVRVVESGKKNIIQSTSSFIAGSIVGKHHTAVKGFAEGPSQRTLKILDISDSTVKFKAVKALLSMPELEQVVLDNCSGLGSEFQSISPKIIKISMVGVNIQMDKLNVLLERSVVLVELNIINNMAITKMEFSKFVSDNKKYISKVILSENNYSNKLIEKTTELPNSTKKYETVENVFLYIDKLLEPEQEHVLFFILKKVSETPKTLKLLTAYGELSPAKIEIQEAKRRKLIDRITKFVTLEGRKLQQLKNLTIDSYTVEEICELYKTVRNTHEIEYLDSSWTFSWEVNQPLSINNKTVVRFSVLPSETIDRVVYRFVRLTRKWGSQRKIEFSMKNNRIIGKQMIDMLLHYAQDTIVSINFLNCIFGFDDVVDLLFEFPQLKEVNEGAYNIKIKQENLVTKSQHFLKMFIRVQDVKAISIDCFKVVEIEILYSVLFHILDKHSSSLKLLRINLNCLVINKQCELFLEKVFSLPVLTTLELRIWSIEEHRHKDPRIRWQEGISGMAELRTLTLRLPSVIFPQINCKKLQSLSIGFSDQLVNEPTVNKILKNIPAAPLKTLCLDFGECEEVANLGKVFGISSGGSIIEKLERIENFSINVEYCNIKQHSLNQAIYALSKCPSIRCVYINASFAVFNWKELQNTVHYLTSAFDRPIKITVIAVNVNSNGYNSCKEFNIQNGIEFVT